MGAGENAAEHDLRLAEELGELAARAGWAVLTGGRASGVMDAALRGAGRVEGSVRIGVVPGPDAGGASVHASVVIVTGLGEARNVVNVLSSDVLVACGRGGAGTASEVALAIKSGTPLVLLAPSDSAEAFFRRLGPIHRAQTPAEALEIADRLRDGGRP